MDTAGSSVDWSLVISIISIIFTVFIYCKYDKITKKQQVSINEYQIKKNDQEEIEKTKANIMANIVKGDRGRVTINVLNTGLADAHNVRFEIVSGNDDFLMVNQKNFPYEKLTSQTCTSFTMIQYEGGSKLEVKFSWDDAYSKGNTYTQIISV